MKKSLTSYFFLAFLLQWICSGYIALCFYASFLAAYSMEKPLSQSLWAAFGTGLFFDLFATSLPFGSFAAIYTLTMLILHSQKGHFYSDSLLSFALLSTFFSLSISTMHLITLQALTPGYTLGIKGFLSSLLFMPFVDGLLAIIWFALPLKGYRYLRKRYARSWVK